MALDPLEHVLDHELEMLGNAVTKYQVLAVLAGLLVCVAYIPLARRIADGTPPRGALWNFLEMILLFIRDQVARPNIKSGHHDHEPPAPGASDYLKEQTTHGHFDHHEHAAGHDPHALADKYVPFLWTLFLFILTCNLLGMIPFLGAPTADFGVTLALAGIVFLVIHVSAIRRLGPAKYVMSYIPRLKSEGLAMNLFLTVVITPLIAVIEVMGALIRSAVLAIRLFANIFAGHVALGVILLFAVMARDEALHHFGGVTMATIFMGTCLSVLELFVAFLQAFVFVLLTSIFLGMQLNPEH
jgi:F-type H+-transporting ATPase subunit a